MKNHSGFSAFRKNASLIFRERLYAFRQWFISIWFIWLARAQAWQAWQEHYEQQDSIPIQHRLDPSMPFAYEDYHQALESSRIGRKARRMGINIPDHLYESIRSPIDGVWILRITDEGLAEIIPKIIDARRKRRQEIGYWLGLAIGLIGALTGLFAVLIK